MWGRAGLIGSTGFVGGELARQRNFARTYSSRTIGSIAGETFDTLVCCGAPAAMWVANANPDVDHRNLEQLAGWIDTASVGRLVLISTIAVLDDLAAGYTESTARYETIKAYGRNRRILETRVLDHAHGYVLRLPALFGPGMKKNFVFDILNPVPSFIQPGPYARALLDFSPGERALAEDMFTMDERVGAYRLHREMLDRSDARHALQIAFARAGLLARSFTNSVSEFQFYNLAHLADDIDGCIARDINILNISSPPWRAADLHQALTGETFVNDGPPVVREDMRTDHASAFSRPDVYLYGRRQIQAELLAFVGGGA